MLYPDWIDTGRVVRDIRSVVERAGTATVTVFTGTSDAHQILAYDVETDEDGVTFPVYDPNLKATAYRGTRPKLRFERTDDGLRMRPYRQYRHALFNRFDQIRRATGRPNAGPLDHVTVDGPTVRESLFPVAVVTVDADAVGLTVTDPDGTEIERTSGRYMDRSRGAYSRIRTAYGAAPGDYRICVFGTEPTDYELTALVADRDGTVVNETHSARLGVGDVHEYELSVPENGSGRLDRTGGDRLESVLVGGAAAVAGLTLGAAGHRALQGRREQTENET